MASALYVDVIDIYRRQRLTADLQAVIHDGVVDVLENIATGGIASPTDRLRLASLSTKLRNELLGDSAPRTIEGLASHLVSECRERGIVASVTKYAEGSPPESILEAFKTAACALIGNVKHADVSRVIITVTSSAHRMDLAIRDDGVGFDPAATTWSSHTKRHVFDALDQLEPAGKAAVWSSPGAGTTWALTWPTAEPR